MADINIDEATVWNLVWADGENHNDRDTPPAEKIEAGWADKEFPPNEWFNWLQYRTDKRLSSLESPVEFIKKFSQHGTRGATLAAGSTYGDDNENNDYVPVYLVGHDHLQVYLDGVLCLAGETYEEVGASGELSSKIKWRVAIDDTYDILCVAPNRANMPWLNPEQAQASAETD